MSNKMLKPIILASLISIASLSQTAMAKSPFENANPDLSCISMFAKELRIIQSLDLSVLQKQSLLNIKETISTHRQEVYQQNNMKQAIIDLLTEPTLDQEKAVDLVKMRTAQVDEFAPDAIAAVARFTDSLTEAQRTLIVDRIQDLQAACDNSFGAFIKQLRTKVSAKLNILIPALSLDNDNSDTEYWADLQYSGTNEEGAPSWSLKEFGENK